MGVAPAQLSEVLRNWHKGHTVPEVGEVTLPLLGMFI